jgi:hypothetical protein
MKRDAKADATILATALERFKRCEEAESENRSRAREDLSFSLGEQWDDAVRRARQNDPNGARPCLTVDKLDQYVRQVVNDARQNKPAIKPRAKDEGADVETAEVLSGIVRHIEDQSSADIAYDTAAEMATRAGFGFLRVVTDYASDDGFEQDILIREVADPFSCYVDPDSTQADGSDARYGFAWEDMPREQFVAQYPDADPCGFEAASEGVGTWIREGTVRVAEYFAVEDEPVRVWQGTDGKASETEIKDAASRTVKRRKVMWRKITAREVIEEREWPSRYIGIVPVYGHRITVGGKRVIRSLVGSAKDAQRMYNYAASAFVERVALTPKAPYVATTAQIEGHETTWQSANTGNYSVLPYNADPNSPPPQRQQAADIHSGWMAVMQSMEHDVQSALGMYNASIGAPSNEKSGKAILARQRTADIATFHVIDNLSRAIRQVGRIVIDLIPRVYDTNRVVRILGEDGSEDFARIDPEQPQASREVHDEQGQVIERIYNPGVGRYDVTVTVGPAYSTKRQEAAEFLTQVVQSSPAMMQVAGDLMFKALDMPYAEEISKRMAKMLPPPLQEQEQGPHVPPEVQQQMQEMGQQVEQLHAQLSSAAAQLGDKRMEYEGKRADLMVKERELAIREYDAETKRLQVVGAGMTPEQVQAIVLDTMRAVATPPAPLGSTGPGYEPMAVPEPGEPPEIEESPGQPEQPEPPEPMEMDEASMPSGGLSPREEPNG